MTFPTGWGRKCEITIPSAKIIGTNTDFILVLRTANFPTEAINGGVNSALNGGGDVRFSLDGAGAARLDVDIRRFVTGGTPDVEVAVRIPSLNSGADRSVWVWYSKAGEIQPASSGFFGAQAVYNGALRVFSMDEDPASAAPQFQDRTAGAAHGTAYNTSSLSVTADGVAFANTDNNTQGHIRSTAIGSITAGGLVLDMKPTNTGKASQYIAKSRSGSNADRLYMLMHNYQLRMRLGGGVEQDMGSMGNNVRTAVAMRWSAGAGTAHKDGTNLGASYSYTGTPGSGSEPLYLGSYDGTYTFGLCTGFEGDLYSAWLFNIDLGQDWLNTFTGMLADVSAFAVAGTPETVTAGANLTISPAGSIQTCDVVGLNHFQVTQIDQAVHGISSEVNVISQQIALVIDPADHAQTVAASPLFQGQAITALSTGHNLVSDEVTLNQLQTLILANATHGLIAADALLFESTGGMPSSRRIFSPRKNNRTSRAVASDRTQRPDHNRTTRI